MRLYPFYFIKCLVALVFFLFGKTSDKVLSQVNETMFTLGNKVLNTSNGDINDLPQGDPSIPRDFSSNPAFNPYTATLNSNLNAIHGPDDSLLFFTFNQYIYDNEGHKLNPKKPLFNPHPENDTYGGTEIVIFPEEDNVLPSSEHDPTTCSTYWVVAVRSNKTSDGWDAALRMFKIDFSEENYLYYPNSPKKKKYGSVTLEVDKQATNGDIGLGSVTYPYTKKKGNYLNLAVTQPNSDGFRYVFLGSNSRLYQYKINFKDGINTWTDNFGHNIEEDKPFQIFNTPCVTSQDHIRSEMEVVAKDGAHGDSYLLAKVGEKYDENIPYVNTQFSYNITTHNQYLIEFLEFERDGGYIKNTGEPVIAQYFQNISKKDCDATNLPNSTDPCNNGRCVVWPDVLFPKHSYDVTAISGLEFNSTGSKLYYTYRSTSNPNTEAGLAKVDLTDLHESKCETGSSYNYGETLSNNLSNPPKCESYLSTGGPTEISNTTHLGYSQIERTPNNKYLMLNSFGYSIYDPVSNTVQDQNVASWSPQLTQTVYPGDYPASTITDFHERSKSYILPEIVHGDDFNDQMTASPECCSNNSVGNKFANYVVEGDETWEPGMNPFEDQEEVRLRDGIIVESGNTLTINDMSFFLGEEANIIVERGAKLVANNSVFNALPYCPDVMWRGFQVWGDRSEYQSISNSSHQGILKLNNCEVKNAVKAIAVTKMDKRSDDVPGYTFKRYDISPQYSGGIVLANHTLFQDNFNSVDFFGYSKKNFSRFKNCSFITENPLKKNKVNSPSKPISPNFHVSLRGVKGVEFKGCSFKNNATNDYTFQERGTGVWSWNSRFNISSRCTNGFPNSHCPDPQDRDRGEFKNLTRGVVAYSWNFLRTPSITDCEFEDNLGGIYLYGSHYPVVAYNDFDIANFPSYNYETYGTYFRECNAYGYEANTFHEGFGQQSGGTTFGTVVANFQKHEPWFNLVYRNKYTDIIVGTEGLGISQAFYGYNGGYEDGAEFKDKGLKFKCNHFESPASMYDNFSGGSPSDSRPVSSTIGQNTNEHDALAGNRFKPCNNPEGQLKVENVATAYDYEYWHQDEPSTTPSANCITQSRVNPQFIPNSSLDLASDCPNRIGPPYIMNPSAGDITLSLRNKIDKANKENDSLKGLIDGGDKAGLLNSIHQDDPSGSVKNDLMDASPYLSDEVLLAAILEKPSPLPAGGLKQIILANSPVTDTVVEALKSRTPQLPNGIMKQVENAQVGFSERDELWSTVNYNNTEIGLAYNRLIRVYIHNDTLVGRLDSIERILHEFDIGHNKCKEAQLEYERENYSEARALLDTVEATSKDEAAFCDVQRTMINLYENQECALKLRSDSVKRATIESVATSDTARHGCASARSIMSLVDRRSYSEVFHIPSGGSSKVHQKERTGRNSESLSQEKVFDIYPNPASSEVIVEIPSGKPNRMVFLRDPMGRRIETKQVPSRSYKLKFNVQNLDPGVYFIQLMDGNGTKEVEKVVISE